METVLVSVPQPTVQPEVPNPGHPPVPPAPKPKRENQFGMRSEEVLRHGPLLDGFLEFVSLSRTPETKRFYGCRLRPLLREWDALPPEAWTKIAFEAYVGKALKGTLPGQRMKWGARTTQMFLGASKLFGEYLNSHDVKTPEFWASIKRPRLHKKEARFFTLAEAKRLIEAAQEGRFAIAIPMGINGFRRAEMTRARWEDVDWERKAIIVHGLKTKTDRRVPVSPILWDVLLKHRKDSGPICGDLKWNVTRDLRALCKAAEIPYKSLHALRHGYATELISRGAPLNAVMRMGGWTQLSTLTRYTHVLPETMNDAAALLA